MRTVVLSTTDPVFNLAAEEYFLLHADGEIRMLWRNARSVIIGKNQNAWAEVNVPYTEAKGIPVVRRLSGGGAVFHDPGNVNYTFITDCGEDEGIDFARFTAPILSVLENLGVTAVLGGRNDILADGRKISGNAQAVVRREDGTPRRLHHGTILYGADLSAMTDALRVHPLKIQSKGVGSVRSRVVNLTDLPTFPKDLTAESFMDLLAAALAEGGTVTTLTPDETEAIERLAQEKYAAWDWNFGTSAAHTTQLTARFPCGTLTASYAALHGEITDIRLYGDYFGVAPIDQLEAALVGVPLRRDALCAALTGAPRPLTDYVAGAVPEELTALLLGETEETESERKGESHG